MMNTLPVWWPEARPFAIMDCLEGMAFIPDKAVDLVVTDPPYAGGFTFGRQQRTIKNDDNLDWLPAMAQELYRVLKDNSWCLVFGQWRTYCEFRRVFEAAGFELKTVGVWDKGLLGMGAGIAEEYEQIFFFKKGKPTTEHRGNVFRVMRHITTEEHPNIKPVDLVDELVKLCSKRGDVVLDPYLGSGTTLLACRRTDRVGIGFEIDPQYEETITKRAIVSTLPLDKWVSV